MRENSRNLRSEILSIPHKQILWKNFRETNFLLKNFIVTWFDENFYMSVNFSFFHTTVYDIFSFSLVFEHVQTTKIESHFLYFMRNLISHNFSCFDQAGCAQCDNFTNFLSFSKFSVKLILEILLQQPFKNRNFMLFNMILLTKIVNENLWSKFKGWFCFLKVIEICGVGGKKEVKSCPFWIAYNF